MPCAWPGMYPIVYFADDGGDEPIPICSKCANKAEPNMVIGYDVPGMDVEPRYEACTICCEVITNGE